MKVNSMKVGVLLIHGITGSPCELDPLASVLQAEGYQVHAMTLPAHGDEPALDMDSVSAEDLLHHCKEEYFRFAEGVSTVYLIGHSLGGICALLLASEQPDKLGGVITFSAPYEHAYWYNQPHAYLKLPFVNILKGGFYDARVSLLVKFKRPRTRLRTAFHLLRESRVLFQKLRRQVVDIQAPACLVHSRCDLTIPYSEMDKLAERIPHAQCRTFHRSGHRIFPASHDLPLAIQCVMEFIQSTLAVPV